MAIFKFVPYCICIILIQNLKYYQLVSCTSVIKTWTFSTAYYSNSDNIQSSVDVIRSLQDGQSEAQCARACTSHNFGEHCQSFQFQKFSGTCELLASQDDVSDKVKDQDEEWSAYKMVQFVLKSFSNLKDEAFETSIVGGMKPDRIVYVSGVPHLNPKRIALNLCVVNPDGEVDYALHVDVRFKYFRDINVVLRSSRISSVFGSSEMEPSGANFPFSPGMAFEIKIIAEISRFQIFVADQHLAYFNYRITPIETITLIRLKGDVNLNMIKIE